MNAKLFRAFVLLALCSSVAHPSHAKPPRNRVAALAGHYIFERERERYSASVELKVSRQPSGSFVCGVVAGFLDGHGAAPDGGGEGRVGADGILRFSFEDSFSNRGTGTLQRISGGRYRLDIDITEVQETRCLPLYGVYVGRRVSTNR